MVNRATQRNLGNFNRTGFDRPPKPNRGSLSNVPSVLDRKEETNSRPTMYNNYLSNHSVQDTLATLDKLQNSLITRSLSPNRGERLISNNDIYFQQQTNRQRQPMPTNFSLIKPAEEFYFKDRSRSVGPPEPLSLHDELEYKTSLERAKDDLELFSRALENNLKKVFPTHQTQEYKDKLDDLVTRLPVILDEMNFKINELMKKQSLSQKQNTTLFELTVHFVNDETLHINLERQRQEIDERLNPMEKHVRDLLVQMDNVKYEVDNKVAEKLNKFQTHKTDSASEILQLKNDLYGFVDNKLNHHSSIMEKRVDTINAFCNEHDMRLKRLIGYKDEIELKLEEQQSLVSQKLLNLTKLEQQIEGKVVEMRRYHQEAILKMKNFEFAQETLQQEVESQLEIMKTHKFQESALKKIVLDVLSPRDKIERENIRKHNKLFKNMETKINNILHNQQSLKKDTDKNTDAISKLELKILTTFQQQIEEMKRIQGSPGKSMSFDARMDSRIKELEDRMNEKSNQTITLFDSAREDIEHNKTNLENLATLYSNLTEGLKKLHKVVSGNEADWKTKINKIEKSFMHGFDEVKTICLDKLETIDKKLNLEREVNAQNQRRVEAIEKQLRELDKTGKITETLKQDIKSPLPVESQDSVDNLHTEKRHLKPTSAVKDEQRVRVQSHDKEEVLFDAEEQEKVEEKKEQTGFFKHNFNVVETLPEIESDEPSKVKDTSELNYDDLSITANEEPSAKRLEYIDDELRPLPSPSPSPREETPTPAGETPTIPAFEKSKSIDQIYMERKKNMKIPEKTPKNSEPQTSKVKAPYSFIGMSSGVGANRPKKPKVEYPRMKRDEFRVKPNIKVSREGDDYYYSLKENQFCIAEKAFEKDVINNVNIANRERREKIYSQKYINNLAQFEDYLFITNKLDKFILELEKDGVTGDEEEAIVIEDSIMTEDIDNDSLFSKSIVASEESKEQNTPQPDKKLGDHRSFKSIKTYELSEDERSPFNFKQKDSAKQAQKRRNTQALELNIDEDDEEEEEEDEHSVSVPSPRSRYGWSLHKQEHERKPSQESNKDKPLTKLSRKPKSISKEASTEEQKGLYETIEMSDFESSANSFAAYSLSKNEESKDSRSPSKEIDRKARSPTKQKPTLETLNDAQKTEILKSVTVDWVDAEINNCVKYLHPNVKYS